MDINQRDATSFDGYAIEYQAVGGESRALVTELGEICSRLDKCLKDVSSIGARSLSAEKVEFEVALDADL